MHRQVQYAMTCAVYIKREDVTSKEYGSVYYCNVNSFINSKFRDTNQ